MVVAATSCESTQRLTYIYILSNTQIDYKIQEGGGRSRGASRARTNTAARGPSIATIRERESERKVNEEEENEKVEEMFAAQ